MFWVYDWLREFGIDSEDKVDAALRDRRVYRNLQEAARQIGSRRIFDLPTKPSLVAGSGIDLTGTGVCSSPQCILAQVDDLVRHVWHYFDTVAVTDPTPTIAATSFKKMNMPAMTAWLKSLIFLQNIGAADILQFVERPNFCAKCLTNHADHYGLERIVQNFDSIVEAVAKDSEVHTRPIGNGMYHEVRLQTPIIDDHFWRTREAATKLKSLDEDVMKRQYTEKMLRTAYTLLFNDVGNAQLGGTPLGATAAMHQFLLNHVGRTEPTTEQVIFNLDLPMLNSVPLKELIAIRKHEGALFNVFQDNIRLAVEETIKNMGSDDIDKITDRVRRDIIEPDLHQIRYALEKNSNALKRTWAMVGLGVTTVTVGTLATGHDPVFSAGASAAIAAAGWAQNVLTAKDDVSKSKMYFLFKATQAARQHINDHDAVIYPGH